MTPSKIRKSLAELLLPFGWEQVPIRRGCVAMFFSHYEGLVCSLGIESSRRYDERFTASLYLGMTFSWSLAAGDFPPHAYRRVGSLLSEEEHTEFGLVNDGWWQGWVHANLHTLGEALGRARGRFFQEPNLVHDVRNSKILITRRDLVHQTMRLCLTGHKLESSLVQPRSRNRLVEAEWYGAAEKVMQESAPAMAHRQGVTSLAEDAWCCHNYGVSL